MEAWLALGVLVCAALLGHAMPPKKHAVGMSEDKVPVIAKAKPVAIPRECRAGSFTASTFPLKPGMSKHGSNPV